MYNEIDREIWRKARDRIAADVVSKRIRAVIVFD